MSVVFLALVRWPRPASLEPVDCLKLLQNLDSYPGSPESPWNERPSLTILLEPSNETPSVLVHPDGVEFEAVGARAGEASKNHIDLEILASEHFLKFRFDPPLAAEEVTLLRLRARSTSSDDRPRVYFSGPDQELDLQRSVPFDFSYDDQFHDVLVPLEDHRLFRGRIETLAIRFMYTQGSLDVEPARVSLAFLELWNLPDPLDRARLSQRTSGESSEGTGTARIDRARIGNEVRPVLYAPAPSRFECSVVVPQNGALDADFGILESAWNKPGDGVTFSVSIRAEGHPEKTLWSQYVDPKSNPSDARWHTQRIPLQPWEGSRVDLVFETKPGENGGPDVDLRADYAVWSNLDLFPLENKNRPPSILLLSLDTLRADRLGCYGYQRPTSPVLDRLASEGMLFEWAISQAPETLASHMSIFTGLFPREHHVWDIQTHALRPDLPFLVESFRHHGYRTAAFTENGAMASVHGFDRGFQSYHDGAQKSDRGEKLVEETFGLASKWIRRYGDRPFFLFVHTYEIHTPYDPPQEMIEHFASEDRGNLTPPISWQKMESRLLRIKEEPLSATDLRFVSDLYDAGIRHTDEQVGGLFDVLSEAGIEETTVRVILSDHGEDFFDHFGFATHGHSLYEEMIRVPLIVAGPGIGERQRGTRVPSQVQLVDLLPTLLDWLEIPFDPQTISGRSFASLIRSGEMIDARPAFSEDFTLFKRTSVRTALDGSLFKLVESPGIESHPFAHRIRDHLDLSRFEGGILQDLELYRLDRDPKELRNLSEEEKERIEELSALLQSYRRKHPLGKSREAARTSDELRKRLERLGYLKPRD